MNPSLYSYDKAKNSSHSGAIESIYSTLTANQLQLHGNTSVSDAAVTMMMGNSSQVERPISIDEHLQSMPPMPMTGWSEQFRLQGEVNMLSMNSANRTVLQTPTLSNQLRNAIVSKGDGAIASSSETSSSSCSPSSIENLHQQRSLKHHDTSFNSAVVSILSHALKPEPSDADFTLGSNGSASLSALRMPAQQMPLHIGTEYGERCLDGNATSGAMSTTSGSSTPAPVRRSRPSHDGLLKCQFCPKKWADQNALHTHMTDCRMMRGHECAQCGKRFKARGGLQQHLRIHSNDRPYACHFCAKRFTQKSHVDQHERIHTGTKPFTCQFCGRAFRQRSQQLGHEATHSSTLASTNQSVTPSSQQLPASADQSKSQHNQEQEDVLRNEPSQPDQRIPDEQPPSAGEQFSLLALGQVPPSSTNTTVSSLLALNQGQMTTSAHGYHFSPSNYLHQGAAIGLLNGLH